MSDLVKRLREVEEDPGLMYGDENCFHVAAEAADRIEALEAENDALRVELLKYAQWMMICPEVSDELRAALSAKEEG